MSLTPEQIERLRTYGAPAPTEDTSSKGHVKNTLATLVRAASGIAPGGLLGAIAGGVGEGVAEQIEDFGSMPNWKRMATEAAIGTIPMGRIIKGGRMVESALKSGAVSAAGDVGRQASTKGIENIDPRETLVQGGLGALTGGALAKFLGLPDIPVGGAKKVRPPDVVVESQTGEKGVPGSAMATRKTVERSADVKGKSWAPQEGPTLPSRADTGTAGVINNLPTERALNKSKAQYAELQRMMDKAERDANRLELRTRQTKKLEKAKEQLTTAKEQGFVPEETITETYKAPNEKGGDETLTRRWKAAKEEGEGGGRGGKRSSQATISDEDTIVPLNPDGTPAPRPPAPSPEEQTKIQKLWMEHQRTDPEKYGTTIGEHAARAREQGAAGNYPPGYVEDLTPEEIARAAGTPTPLTPPPNAPPAPGENEHLAKFIGAKLRSQKNPINPVPAGPIALAEDVYNEALKAGMSPKEAHAMAQSVLPGAEVSLPKGAGTHSGGGVPPVEAPPTLEVPTTPISQGATQAPIPSWSPLAGRPIPRTGAEMEAGPLIEGGAAPLNFIRGKNYSQYLKSQYGELKDLLKAHPKETWSSPEVAPLHTQYKEAGKLAETRKRFEKAGRLKSWDELNKAQNKGEAGFIANNPKLMLQLMLGAGGGMLGAAGNPDHPILGGLAGAGIGAGLPMVPGALSNISDSDAIRRVADFIDNPEALSKGMSKAAEWAPKVQRANILSNTAYPANAFLGPYGSGIMGTLEEALAGNEPAQRGLYEMMDPIKFGKRVMQSFPEARRKIGRAEDLALGLNPSKAELAVAAPGIGMTAGDEATRTGLENIAGMSEDLARRYSLTSEAEYPPLRRLQDWVKGHPLAQMALPFVRTPANIIEQGVQRIPFVGSLAHKYQKVPDSLRQQLVQQALGGATMLGGGVLGANIDPENKWAPKYLANMMGVYSLPATLGYGIGRAYQQGKVDGPRSAISHGLKGFWNEIPLPTFRGIEDVYNFLSDGEKPLSERIPSSMYPRILKELKDYLDEQSYDGAPF